MPAVGYQEPDVFRIHSAEWFQYSSSQRSISPSPVNAETWTTARLSNLLSITRTRLGQVALVNGYDMSALRWLADKDRQVLGRKFS